MLLMSFYAICICLHIVVSSTYCVVFLFCLSSSCVPDVASCVFVLFVFVLCTDVASCVFVLFVFVLCTGCCQLCFCFVCLRLVYRMLPVVFLFCLSSSCVPDVASCVFVLFVFVLCTRMLPVVFLFCLSSSCVPGCCQFAPLVF